MHVHIIIVKKLPSLIAGICYGMSWHNVRVHVV